MADGIPKGLGKAGREFWRSATKEFVLETTHDLRRLEMACGCLDVIEAAEKVVKKEGLFVEDRFKQRREHPGAKTIRDNKVVFCRIIRELGLDIEEGPETRLPRRY